MPSVFESMFAKQLSGSVYTTFGVDAAYISPRGVTTLVNIRVQSGDVRQVELDGVMGEAQTGFIHVLQTELALVEKGGRFRISPDQVWTVEVTPDLRNGQFTCSVVRKGVAGMMTRRTKDA